MPVNISTGSGLCSGKKGKGNDNMKKILMVIDMQNDFIDGALGTKEAVGIVPAVVKTVNEFDGEVIFTKDTPDFEVSSGDDLPF